MKHQLFAIDGMHCTACALNIDLDLEELPGVQKATTHYAKQITEVVYDPQKIDLKQILQCILATGYRAAVKDQI